MDYGKDGNESPDLAKVEKLLQSWATKICESTNDIVSTALGRNNDFSSQGAHGIFDDMRDRQSRIITTIQEAHSRQLEMLKTAVAEERKEFSRAQLIFEQSLKTKYDHIVDALQETIKAEHDSRLLRTVKSLESQARLESERAKQAFEVEQEVEALLAKRLKGIIADLRRSWEVEEAGRMRQMEDRLRANYNAMLDHMEAQLRLALQWQDDADQKWLEELDIRNKKQLESVRLFEEKCRRLYETRLESYAEKTRAQVAGYEEQLLEVGTALAAEKAQFESRLRRLKLASSRWKMAFQKDLHEKYRALSDSLEDRFLSEMDGLLEEIKDLRGQLREAQRSLELKEKEVVKMHEMHLQASDGGGNPQMKLSLQPTGIAMSKVRADLCQRWDELKTPPAERVATLCALLDNASPTPAALALYENISAKLTDRVPIAQLLSRKQFVEYKLKLSAAGGGGGLSTSERADLISQLSEVKSQIDRLARNYEKTHNEPCLLTGLGSGFVGSGGGSDAVLSAFSPLSPKK